MALWLCGNNHAYRWNYLFNNWKLNRLMAVVLAFNQPMAVNAMSIQYIVAKCHQCLISQCLLWPIMKESGNPVGVICMYWWLTVAQPVKPSGHANGVAHKAAWKAWRLINKRIGCESETWRKQRRLAAKWPSAWPAAKWLAWKAQAQWRQLLALINGVMA